MDCIIAANVINAAIEHQGSGSALSDSLCSDCIQYGALKIDDVRMRAISRQILHDHSKCTELNTDNMVK